LLRKIDSPWLPCTCVHISNRLNAVCSEADLGAGAPYLSVPERNCCLRSQKTAAPRSSEGSTATINHILQRSST
jgi:hypothetical protein